jgi:pimeloyl-ACP methyl ester carboxylesterase
MSMKRDGHLELVAATAVATLIVAMGALTGTSRAAAAPTYAPLNQPGPPLTVPSSALQASLVCQPAVKDARVTPVLLNPATGVTAAENYSWNWEPALTKLGIPWCAYTAPNDTLGDIQTSGEYVVYAIRTMYALAGRKITVMGHSQGGMSMRWALRFWPDTRPMVQSVIGFSGSNHGTTVISSSACALGCPPADWEQFYGSPFIDALNSYAETFPGISYTEVWTHTDEVVQPNGSAATASAALHTGGGAITNVPTQQVCPGDVDEHLMIGTIDPVAYALAVDALTHTAPADPAAIPSSVCSQTYMPGVNPANVNMYLEILEGAPSLGSVTVGSLANAASGAPELYAQPPLECYVSATCHGADAPTLALSAPARGRAGTHTTLHARVLVTEGSQQVAVPDVTVSLDGHHALTGAGGRVTLVLALKTGQRYTWRASRAGCNPATKTLHAFGHQ